MTSFVDSVVGAIREAAKKTDIPILPDSDLSKVINHLMMSGTTEGGIHSTDYNGSFDGDDFIDVLERYLETSWLPTLRSELLDIASCSQSGLLQARLVQQLRPAVVNQLRSELEAPIRAKIAEEATALREQFREQCLAEVREELRRELHDDVKNELRPEIANILRLELRESVTAALRQEIISKLALE